MRKLYTLLLSLLFATTSQILLAQTVTITGTSNFTTSNTYGPMNTSTTDNSNRHAYIYPSSLLSSMAAGSVINSLAFERNNTTSTVPAGASFKIYIKNTSLNDWGSGALDWSTAISGADLVYNSDPSTVIGNSGGWKVFTLSTPYTYNGGNLAIIVEYIQPAGPSTAINWIYNASGGQPAYEANQTKYTNSTTTTLGTSLTSSEERHPNLQINYTPAPACTGTPNPGNTQSTATLVCDTENFTLSFQNTVFGSGVTYQWQSSLNGVSFSDISGATNTTYTTSQTATTYYQVVVTCSGSGSAASTPIQINQNIFSAPTSATETFSNTIPPFC